MTSSPKTLLDKLWNSHLVKHGGNDHPDVIYIDCHLLHEITSAQAFAFLEKKKLAVRRADLTYATVDHAVPSMKNKPWLPGSKRLVSQLKENCQRHGIKFFDLGDPYHGIVHVIGPELGLSQPGQTIVCGDSHTSTHGAFAALAFGIGSSEVAHVLGSQCLLQHKPKSLLVSLKNSLKSGVTAKDIILTIINRIGNKGATGYVIEYGGPTIRQLNMEQRMTICNMSIEAGAKSGIIGADEVTTEYLRNTNLVLI